MNIQYGWGKQCHGNYHANSIDHFLTMYQILDNRRIAVLKYCILSWGTLWFPHSKTKMALQQVASFDSLEQLGAVFKLQTTAWYADLSVSQMHCIVVRIFHVRTCWSAGFCSSSWRPGRFQRARVCWVLAWWSLWDTEGKEKTERNNAGELEPGYSAQFDAATASAAASNRHEQEKSIRLTRLLSKGLLPWERVEGIKAFEDGGKTKGRKCTEGK